MEEATVVASTDTALGQLERHVRQSLNICIADMCNIGQFSTSWLQVLQKDS